VLFWGAGERVSKFILVNIGICLKILKANPDKVLFLFSSAGKEFRNGNYLLVKLL
jgi:hypothetical protein